MSSRWSQCCYSTTLDYKSNLPVQIVVVPQSISRDLVLLLVDSIRQRQPWMRQSRPHVHTLVPVKHQQLRNEVPGLRTEARPPFLIVPAPSAFLNSRQSLAVVLTSEWRVSAEQDVGYDTDTPHVGWEGDAIAVGHFGSYILRHPVVEGAQFVVSYAAW